MIKLTIATRWRGKGRGKGEGGWGCRATAQHRFRPASLSLWCCVCYLLTEAQVNIPLPHSSCACQTCVPTLRRVPAGLPLSLYPCPSLSGLQLQPALFVLHFVAQKRKKNIADFVFLAGEFSKEVANCNYARPTYPACGRAALGMHSFYIHFHVHREKVQFMPDSKLIGYFDAEHCSLLFASTLFVAIK